MKKFLLLFCFCIALSASADTFTTNDIRPLKNPVTQLKHSMAGETIMTPNELGQINPLSTAVIYDRPAGELRAYNRSGGAFVFDEGLHVAPQSGKTYVVYGEDGKVYLRNPVFGLPLGTWVEGTLSEDGTQIIVPMGQTIYDAENGITLDLCWGSTHYEYPEGGNGQSVRIIFTIDERVTEAIYTIKGDCIYLEGTKGHIDAEFPEDAVMTGLSAAWSDNKNWEGCIDYGTVYTECSYFEPLPVITEQPEGEIVEYFRSGESSYGVLFYEQKGKVYVVYGENGKVYLKDPFYGYKFGTWTEGYLSDDGVTITIPMNQCIFWDLDNENGLIVKNVTLFVDEQGTIYYSINERVTEMTYTIDGNTISMNETYGDMNADWPTQMCGLGLIKNDDLFLFECDWNTVYTKIIPAVPADPSLDETDTGAVNAWYDHGKDNGFSYLVHYIKLEDVNGNLIDADKISYSIFTDDDQIFVFTTEEYPQLDEDMTELPYNLNSYTLNPSFTYFYRTNAEGYEPFFNDRIGIQVYYMVDGVRNASQIVYCGKEPTYAENGTPKNPAVHEWYDFGNESGYSKLTYTISKYTTEGKSMDLNRVYYSIFTDDDQLFTFRADQYTHDLDEDMTMIPYNLLGYDFHNNYCYFYRTNAAGYDPFFNWRIGIQVHYLCENGELTASDIVYLEVFEHDTNVNEIAECKTVAGVKYYNMAGQEMREANGICIAVITYTDGTTSAVKLVK